MSEKENETIDHWIHADHPLSLVETRIGNICSGCFGNFSRGEQAYGCSKKCDVLLHQECAEMATMIRHPMHPQHLLIQDDSFDVLHCSVCKQNIWSLGYYCSQCGFQIHLRCAQDSGVMDADDDDEESRILEHPSHPQHQLRLLRRRRCSFRCDACGTMQKGNSYLCILCQYWIHQTCAFLPHTIQREDHHHSLSLSFRPPLEYIENNYKCDVCQKDLVLKYWIYHCQLCRYIVHVNCAFKKSPIVTTRNDANTSGEKDIVHFPINDAAEEQITPFIIREGGAIAAIDDEMDMNGVYKFHFHKHQLRLTSLLSSHDDDQNQEDEDKDEDEDEDEDDSGVLKSKLVCDGCTTPIFQKQQRSLSSSSSSSNCKHYYYMSCSECNYILHLACFHLPPQLPSLPSHNKPNHTLILQSCDKLEFNTECSVCRFDTNGLLYTCTRCEFKADIKCASLPNTMYHAAHPQHPLKYLNVRGVDSIYTWRQCAAYCRSEADFDSFDYYVCEECEFFLHVSCAVLPPSVKNRRCDKHPLPLTYDACVNHPGEFYCDECETIMHPKMWMYHCRLCDQSFHPGCFAAASGYCRNMKLGKQYLIGAAHPHPLTYQLLTTKLRCDVCGGEAYHSLGFMCALCNFFICFFRCGDKMRRNGDIQVVD